jgi:hypothetical protein
MGWYTNYEVEFDEYIEWDDSDTKNCLSKFNVQYLYLRDLDTPRLILCVYSQNPVEKILTVLKNRYFDRLRYRVYGTEAWIRF